jgi:hypothetical protein
LSVRIVRELRHGDEAVGGTELDAVIVRTKVLDVAEAVSREQQRLSVRHALLKAGRQRPDGVIGLLPIEKERTLKQLLVPSRILRLAQRACTLP